MGGPAGLVPTRQRAKIQPVRGKRHFAGRDPLAIDDRII